MPVAAADPVTETATAISDQIGRHRAQRAAALADAAAHRRAIAELTTLRNQHIKVSAATGRPLAVLARLYNLSRERARQIVTAGHPDRRVPDGTRAGRESR